MSFRPKYVLFAGICKVLKVVFWIAALISPLSMRIRIKRSKELLKRTLDTTLVIVDMQPSFDASALVLPDVMDEVKLALQNDWAIVILEFYNQGPTYPCILELAKQSRRHTVETKFKNGGEREIRVACQRLNLPTARFRVCGVNTHACVSATVNGIAKTYAQSMVVVVQNACAHTLRQNNWRKFFRFKSFRVVPAV